MLTTYPRFGSTLHHPFESVRREFDRFFGMDGNGRESSEQTSLYVPVTLWDDDEKVYLQIDVPGFQQEELDLTVQDGMLTIRGERKWPERPGKVWYDERRYGAFERIIRLSDAVDPDSIDATLEYGVLSITLSKKPEAKPHRIAIKAAANGKKHLEKK